MLEEKQNDKDENEICYRKNSMSDWNEKGFQ